MGIRDSLRKRVKAVVDKLSGDYSAAAPETLEAYRKPGAPQQDAKVVMAQLRRPPPSKGESEED